MIQSVIERVVRMHTPEDEMPEEWNVQAIVDYVQANLLYEGDVTINDLRGKDPEEMIEFIWNKVRARYDEKKAAFQPSKCASLSASSSCVLSI